MSDFSIERSSTLYHYVDEVYWFSRNFWRERKVLNDFDNFFKSVVGEMRLQMQKKAVGVETKLKKVVDVLFDEKNEFSNDEVVDHVKALVYGVSEKFGLSRKNSNAPKV